MANKFIHAIYDDDDKLLDAVKHLKKEEIYMILRNTIMYFSAFTVCLKDMLIKYMKMGFAEIMTVNTELTKLMCFATKQVVTKQHYN